MSNTTYLWHLAVYDCPRAEDERRLLGWYWCRPLKHEVTARNAAEKLQTLHSGYVFRVTKSRVTSAGII